jgi:hypothetical protein
LASSVLAILNNSKYIGLIRWGVTQWDRSAADSSVRRVKQLASPRVERTDERLRIVPQELCNEACPSDRQTQIVGGTPQRATPVPGGLHASPSVKL